MRAWRWVLARVVPLTLPSVVMVAMGLLISGCSTKVEVQSSGCWDGVVGGASVTGCGARRWQARAGECYVFQKSDADGWLRARVLGWKGDDRWVETRAAYGVVTVCAQP